MALTKSDLSAIKRIVVGETKPLVGRLDKVDSRLDKVDSKLTKLEKGQMKIKKDLEIVVKSFDSEYLGLKKRLTKIESHLGFEPPEF